MSADERFQSILGEAQKGEHWALSELYRELQPRLLRYLWSQDRTQAEDLASEVWIDVATGLGRFSGGESSFRSWVFTIARRRVIDYRRSAASRRSHPAPPDAFDDLPAPGTPETQFIESEATKEAIDRISTLPSRQAEVLILRIVAGLDVAEVADVLGKRPGAVRVLQHRGLRKLALEISKTAVTK